MVIEETDGQTAHGGRVRRTMQQRASVADINPLCWWRRVAPADLDSSDAVRLAAAIGNIEFLGESRWREAKAGDAPAAVGCALSLLSAGITARLDVAMSAVLICALQGNPASLLLLKYAAQTLSVPPLRTNEPLSKRTAKRTAVRARRANRPWSFQ